MALTKPNQQLRRDLKEAAAILDDAAQDLFREAKTYAEPEFLAAMERIEKLHGCIDKLAGYADEVKAGRIVRNKAELSDITTTLPH
ncbi:hypothetical protein [Pseudomonas asplenii]|uniref:Uncharacterized protein n=1 Tax=Pseudomonas asplenii TaxID=53407 RepID=A0A1H6NMR5_9PSED|nr:hypothetical protein [Pseudomonas fuscovaginae]SEI17084.1 hypothetical protein SAMN05216581_3303 [Pseudomonas fuscovaginae]